MPSDATERSMSLFGREGGEDSESKKMFTSFSHDIWLNYSDATRPISPNKVADEEKSLYFREMRIGEIF